MADLLTTLNKGLDTIDKAVIDQDLKNQLQHDIVMKYADVMFRGPGSKITKWTLCFLVTSVVWTILYTFMTGGKMDGVLAVSAACSGVIGLMTGGFAYGTSQKRKWNALSNGNGTTNGSQSTTRGSRGLRPAPLVRPVFEPVGDRGPSDTKREHPSGR